MTDLKLTLNVVDDEMRDLQMKYGHIKSTRDAMKAIAMNCALAPPNADFGWFDSPAQLVECVAQWTRILGSSSLDLFDPADGGTVSEKVRKELERRLYHDYSHFVSPLNIHL